MTPDAPPAPPPAVEVHAWIGADVALARLRKVEVHSDLARLQARLHRGRIDAMVQVETHTTDAHLGTGHADLVDAVTTVHLGEGASVRAGLFKTPLSQEDQVPIPAMHLPTRPLVVSATPGREVGLEAAIERGPATVRLGVFESGEGPRLSVPRPVLAVDLEVARDLAVHGALSTRWMGTQDVEHVETQRWDHVGDLGIGWRHEGTTLAIEGLVAHVVASDRWEGGVHALAAQRFPAGLAEVEVALGVDSVVLDGSAMQRLTQALNVHFGPLHTLARLSIESVVRSAAQPVEQVARAQLELEF